MILSTARASRARLRSSRAKPSPASPSPLVPADRAHPPRRRSRGRVVDVHGSLFQFVKSVVVRQKRPGAPQLPRLHLRGDGLRGLVVEPGLLRVESAGTHLRAPHVELGVLVLLQAGGVGERPRRRIRVGGKGRRRDAVAVACVLIKWSVGFRSFFGDDDARPERRMRTRTGRRVRTGAARGRGDGETGRRGRGRARRPRVFPESRRARPEAFRAKRAGERAGATGRRGHLSCLET